VQPQRLALLRTQLPERRRDARLQLTRAGELLDDLDLRRGQSAKLTTEPIDGAALRSAATHMVNEGVRSDPVEPRSTPALILRPAAPAILESTQKRRAQQIERDLRITTSAREIAEQIVRMRVIQRDDILGIDNPATAHRTKDEVTRPSVTLERQTSKCKATHHRPPSTEEQRNASPHPTTLASPSTQPCRISQRSDGSGLSRPCAPRQARGPKNDETQASRGSRLQPSELCPR
jgi:hypothetical protein